MVEKFRGSLDGGVEGGEPAEKKVPECKGRESSRKAGTDFTFCRTVKQRKVCVAVLKWAGLKAR